MGWQEKIIASKKADKLMQMIAMEPPPIRYCVFLLASLFFVGCIAQNTVPNEPLTLLEENPKETIIPVKNESYFHIGNDNRSLPDYYLDKTLLNCLDGSQFSQFTTLQINNETKPLEARIKICTVPPQSIKYVNKSNSADYFFAWATVGISGYTTLINGSSVSYRRDYTIHIVSHLNESIREKTISHELCHIEQNIQNRPYDELECYLKSGVL